MDGMIDQKCFWSNYKIFHLNLHSWAKILLDIRFGDIKFSPGPAQTLPVRSYGVWEGLHLVKIVITNYFGGKACQEQFNHYYAVILLQNYNIILLYLYVCELYPG